MEFDQDQWDAIVKQWEQDDAEEAARQAPEPLSGDPSQAPVAPKFRLRDSVQESANQASEPSQPNQPDWKDLQDNLNNAQGQAQLSRAAEHMFENVSMGGYKTDPGRFEAQMREAELPLQMAKEKQGWERMQQQLASNKAQMDAQKVQADALAASRDPSSPQSQRARESIKAFFKGVELPQDFDSWSAEDVVKFGQAPLEKLAMAKKAASAPKADPEVQRQAWLNTIIDSGRYNEGLKTLGNGNLEAGKAKFRTLDQKSGQDLQNAWEADKTRASQIEAAREGRAVTASQREADQVAKVVKDTAELSALGSRVDSILEQASQNGGKLPGTGMKQALLQWFGNKTGVDFRTPEEMDVRKQLAGIKNDYIHAITGAGMGIEEAKRIVNAAFDENSSSDADILSGLRNLKQRAESEIQAHLRGLSSAAKKQVTGGSSSQPGSPVKMKFPDGSVQSVPADKIEKAKKKGGVIVNG